MYAAHKGGLGMLLLAYTSQGQLHFLDDTISLIMPGLY